MKIKPRVSPGFLILVVGLVLLSGAGIALKRQEASLLQTELEMARTEAAELKAMRAENQGLREKQIPIAELERLRADHIALLRLRTELENLRKQ